VWSKSTTLPRFVALAWLVFGYRVIEQIHSTQTHSLTSTQVISIHLSMPCLTFCAWGTRIALGRMHTFALVMICIISQCCIWSTWFPVVNHSWVRSIVGRTLFSTCELFLFCAKLLVEQVTISCLIHLLMVNQHGQLSFPSLRGWLLSSNPCYSGQTAEGILRGVAYHQCQWVLLAARL